MNVKPKRAETPPSPFAFNPEKPVIKIVVSPDLETLSVIPMTARIKAGTPIEWAVWVVGEDGVPRPRRGTWLLAFRDVKAVGHNQVRSGARGDQAATAGEPGRYHYKVMVTVGGRIYADVGCPSMEIKR